MTRRNRSTSHLPTHRVGASGLPLLFLGTLLTSALGGCSGDATTTEHTISTALVVQPDSTRAGHDSFAGEVRARYEPDLAFQVGGKVIERLVEVGDRVEKGQPLARIDPRDVRLQLDASRARVAAAKADHDLALSEQKRYQTLLERKVISQSQYDSVSSQLEAAAAQLRQAHADLEVARNQAGYAELHAPRNGVIMSRQVEVGQVVAAGQTVFTLAADGDREVLIHLPENRVNQVSLKQDVKVELWSRPGDHYDGRVREIAPSADPQLRTYAARVAFTSDDVPADLGQSARVFFPQGGTRMSIPLSALTAEEGAPYVWKVNPADQTLVKAPVRVGPYQEDEVPVLAGLEAGDWIVAAGAQLFREGQTVKPVDRRNRQVDFGDGGH
ncbi:resistance-nodulation-cell division (RND) efflux membrane fusion protein [Alloalcanivorax dieselolei]|uniref:efflux RND transporter periplasmic adaptor subunit n=1 Tax=Alloalcanivorax dieselolei TaxID=285091 RepID=UPI000686190A|nr:efflux RND transporter periplasmic adaptor subunit [Alloalcanivorax dieselolei]GGK05018.1 resistance-nodulation-cell division (RND) efflux membrane fusion protein [Alloalcanivorax dieselolei]